MFHVKQFTEDLKMTIQKAFMLGIKYAQLGIEITKLDARIPSASYIIRREKLELKRAIILLRIYQIKR